MFFLQYIGRQAYPSPQQTSLYQWNTVSQPYPTVTSPANDQPQNGSMSPVHDASPTSLVHPTYVNSNNTQPQYPAYYNTSNYPPSSSGNNNQQMYPNAMPMNYGQPYHHSQPVPTPQSPVPQTAYQPHAYLNPYPHSPPLSNSQTQAFGVPSGEKEQPYRVQEVPQTIGLSSDYPTSPGRPFSCDLCALSFNRQHDLKRHRETHTGEKPYLCNGGCGKTFTRKDALKRHQVCRFLEINSTYTLAYNVSPRLSKTAVKSNPGANAKVLRYIPTPCQ